MTRHALLLAALALAPSLSSCGKGSAPAPAEDAGTPQPGVAPAPGLPSPAHVSTATTLRREPSDAPRAKGTGKKDVANTLAFLLRGERVTLLEVKDEWARVRSSDDSEGWLKRASLLEGEGVTEATVLAPADVFDRPDLLAANARRKVEPGTLLLVVRTRPPFSEVSVGSGPNAWVLSERLAAGEREVSVAKLAEKARWLKRNGKDDEARQILALARQQFAGTALLDALAVELGEAPPAGQVVPASTATPPPPNPD